MSGGYNPNQGPVFGGGGYGNGGAMGTIGSQLGTNSNQQVYAPDPSAYQYGTAAGGAQQHYEQVGNDALNRQGAQIQNQYGDADRSTTQGVMGQEGLLQDYYKGVLNGTAPSLAQAQMNAATDQTINAQMAMANSAKGPLATALAERNASVSGSQMGMQAAQQAMIGRIQEEQNAAAGQSNLLGQMGQQAGQLQGLDAQTAAQQAALQQQQQGINAQTQMGMYGLGQTAQGEALQGQIAGQQANLQASGQGIQQSEFNAGQNANLFGGFMGAAEGLLTSDVTKKMDIVPAGDGVIAGQGNMGAPGMMGAPAAGAMNVPEGAQLSATLAPAAGPSSGGIVGRFGGALKGLAKGLGGGGSAVAVPSMSGYLLSDARAKDEAREEGYRAAVKDVTGNHKLLGQLAGAHPPAMVGTPDNQWARTPQGYVAYESPPPPQLPPPPTPTQAAAMGFTTPGVEHPPPAPPPAAAQLSQAAPPPAADPRLAMSDERAKDRRPGGTTDADAFLGTLHPSTYRYKNPGDEPTNAPTGDRYLGIMAQDVERGPTGRTIVKETPRGKAIDEAPALSAVMAGLGRLHERLSHLEGR